MKKNRQPSMFIILPCFNEEESVEESAKELRRILLSMKNVGEISRQSSILFVDDGSKDDTWGKICNLNCEDSQIKGIRLSKNKGHQTALVAGIEYSVNHADVMITMDADLQQDASRLPDFLYMYNQGYDIVYGIRKNRSTDSFLKMASAVLYYKLMNVMGCEIYENSADYRMLSRRAGKALMKHEESNLFLRGLVPTLGFKTGTLFFDVKKRKNGTSKYTLYKMIHLAVDGITSFSIKPIHMILYLGIIILIFSIAMMTYTFIAHYIFDTQSGWASLSTAIWFLGGAQLTGIGVIGEYVGKTYMESKHRPRYFIQDTCVSEQECENEDKD